MTGRQLSQCRDDGLVARGMNGSTPGTQSMEIPASHGMELPGRSGNRLERFLPGPQEIAPRLRRRAADKGNCRSEPPARDCGFPTIDSLAGPPLPRAGALIQGIFGCWIIPGRLAGDHSGSGNRFVADKSQSPTSRLPLFRRPQKKLLTTQFRRSCQGTPVTIGSGNAFVAGKRQSPTSRLQRPKRPGQKIGAFFIAAVVTSAGSQTFLI